MHENGHLLLWYLHNLEIMFHNTPLQDFPRDLVKLIKKQKYKTKKDKINL